MRGSLIARDGKTENFVCGGASLTRTEGQEVCSWYSSLAALTFRTRRILGAFGKIIPKGIVVMCALGWQSKSISEVTAYEVASLAFVTVHGQMVTSAGR